MIEVIIEDKQAYLNENYLCEDIPNMTDQKICLHCNKTITVGEFKVYKDHKGMEYIYCPNAPDCNGTLIDWLPVDYDFD